LNEPELHTPFQGCQFARQWLALNAAQLMSGFLKPVRVESISAPRSSMLSERKR
jgi:hypothetical protein